MKRRSGLPRYYPILFNIQDKKCVVVGGGVVGLRKVEMLLDCGARVTVISPNPRPEIVKLFRERAIHLLRRNYRTGDLDGTAIAIAATDLKRVNRKVAKEARKAKVPVNVADDPEPSDFIMPAYFRRGDLTVAVSTGGESPAFARRIRTKLEKSLGREYTCLLSWVGEVRSAIKRKGVSVSPEAWQKALDLDLLARLAKKGQRKKAKDLLLSQLGRASKATKTIADISKESSLMRKRKKQ